MRFSTSYQLLVIALVSTIASSYTDGWAGDGNEVIDQTFCGAGVVGNGVCEIVVDENGEALEPCCSNAGFCGYGLAYCGETGEGGGEGYCEIDPLIAGACLTEGECCSEFGFCSTQFCGEGGGGEGGGECLLDEDCLIQADCVAGDCCCSQYGYCGTSAEYCGGGEETGGIGKTTAPTFVPIVTPAPTPEPTGATEPLVTEAPVTPAPTDGTEQVTPVPTTNAPTSEHKEDGWAGDAHPTLNPTEEPTASIAPTDGTEFVNPLPTSEAPTSEHKEDGWGGDAHLDTLHPTMYPTMYPTDNTETNTDGWGGDAYQPIDREDTHSADTLFVHGKSGKSSKGSKSSRYGTEYQSSYMFANSSPVTSSNSIASMLVTAMIVALLK
jgi:hypothetical protein